MHNLNEIANTSENLRNDNFVNPNDLSNESNNICNDNNAVENEKSRKSEKDKSQKNEPGSSKKRGKSEKDESIRIETKLGNKKSKTEKGAEASKDENRKSNKTSQKKDLSEISDSKNPKSRKSKDKSSHKNKDENSKSLDLKQSKQKKSLSKKNEDKSNKEDILQDRTDKRQQIIDNAVSQGQLKLVDFSKLKGDELKKELDKQNKEREKRMAKYMKFDEVVIKGDSDEENLDEKIQALENELTNLKQNIKEIVDKPLESKALLLRKKDWLTFKSLELEHLFDATGYKFEMLEKKHKAMQEALKNIESVATDMKTLVKYRAMLHKLQMGLKDADTVILEMQDMAYKLLPGSVSKHCKEVEETRKRLIDMQDDLLEKKHYAKKELIITRKEILAINEAVKGEIEATNLLESRKGQELNRLVNFQARNNEIDEIIENCNEKLDLMNLTLEEAQEMAIKSQHEVSNVKRKSLAISDETISELKWNVKEEKIIEIKEMNVMMKEQIAKLIVQIEEVDREIVQNESVANLGTEITQMLENISKATAERRSVAEKLQSEKVLRKTYYNQIEDMKGAIRVYCRVRPINNIEKNRKDTLCVEFPDIYTVVIKQPEKKIPAERTREFLFDRVYGINSTQSEIFKDVDRLIEITFNGFNVCIFAYGQTGSGKTYTLIGDMDSKEKMGIVPRAFIRFYELIEANKHSVLTETSFYMVELYNDKVLDLMKSDADYEEKLKIVKNEHGMVIVPGVTMLNPKSTSEMIKYFHLANNNRHIASTKMNSQSSRSHLILTVMFTFTNVSNKKKFFGKISMVDLAGSERLSKSGVTGINQIEATSINKALTALGDVISALTTMSKGFVPYRNNKLTLLMQDSLGGTAKTLLLVNLSPVDYNVSESLSSLQYAVRMKTIVNENLKVADDEEVSRLKNIIHKLIRGEPVVIN